jgi:hypothetical protein
VQSSLGLDPVFVVYVAAFGLTSAACFAALTRTSRIEDADTRRGLQWLLGLSGAWGAAHVAFLTLPGQTPRLLAYYAGLTVGFTAVGAWLYFCSAYTGRGLHRQTGYRRVAVATLLLVLAVKYTNPIHGLYFTATPAAMPFPHLSVEHHLFHWLAMGLSYAAAAVGYFMLLELFTQTGYDTRPLAVLVGLTGLPVVFDVAGMQLPGVVDMTYEPLGVAAFAVGRCSCSSAGSARSDSRGRSTTPWCFSTATAVSATRTVGQWSCFPLSRARSATRSRTSFRNSGRGSTTSRSSNSCGTASHATTGCRRTRSPSAGRRSDGWCSSRT